MLAQEYKNHTWKNWYEWTSPKTWWVSLTECYCYFVNEKSKTKLRNIFDAQFESDLHGDVRNNGEGNKLRTLRMFKRNMKEELYLTLIANRNIRTKLRISAHNLPIETGRHRRNGKIPLKSRKENVICVMITPYKSIGSEFHTVMSCEALSVPRKCMFDEISIIFPPFKVIKRCVRMGSSFS